MAIIDKSQKETQKESLFESDALHTEGTQKNDTSNGDVQQMSLLGGFNPIIPENMGSAYTDKFHSYLKEIYTEHQNQIGFKIDLYKMDRNIEEDLAYSAIVVCVSESQRVAYHIMVLAATGDAEPTLSSIPAQFNPQQADVIRVPSDAFDHYFITKVERLVASKYKSSKLLATDGVVIPSTFKLESIADIHHEAVQAALACQSELITHNSNFKDISIGQLSKEAAASGYQLTIEVSPQRGTIQNEVQLPVRHSWVVELNTKSLQNNDRSIHVRNAKKKLIRSIGYTDVLPTTVPMQVGMGYTQNVTRFQPHVIVDAVTASAPTLGSVVAGLACASAVTTNELWMTTVKPQADDEMHDPGALNLQANLENDESGIGDPDIFKNTDLSEAEVMELMRRIFVPNVVFSVDVEHYGPETWELAAFSAAAPGSPHATNATNAIARAADDLTDGKFSKKFKGDVVIASTLVPTGYWEDKNGVLRDLREIDYTAVANTLGREDANALIEWAVLNVPTGNTDVQTIIRRMNIIRRVVTDATITGWVTRVTLNPEFLQVLNECMAESGFTAILQAPTVVQGVADLSVVNDFVTRAAFKGGATPFVQQVGMQQGGPVIYNSMPGMNRW